MGLKNIFPLDKITFTKISKILICLLLNVF